MGETTECKGREGGGLTEGLDVTAPDDPGLVVVVLHPHPRFGGNRFHPFVDSLYRRLPSVGVAAVRFDFASEEAAAAHSQVEAAIETVASSWPGLGVVVAGYSFGAGVAAGLDDRRLRGWLLLAPQAEPLSNSPLESDERPKLVLVPEHDQFGPPEVLRRIVDGWPNTTLSVIPDADHFLRDVGSIVDTSVEWIRAFLVS